MGGHYRVGCSKFGVRGSQVLHSIGGFGIVASASVGLKGKNKSRQPLEHDKLAEMALGAVTGFML